MSTATKQGWHQIHEIFRCEKEWELAKIHKVREPQAKTPDYFAIGLLVHAAKAHWFNRKCEGGFDEDILQAMVHERVTHEAETNMPFEDKAFERGVHYVGEYIGYWQHMPKPTVIAAEYSIGPISLDGSGDETTMRTARLDDVGQYPEGGNLIWLGESKTTSGSINDCVKEYELHGQPTLQKILWKLAPNGEAMHGSVAGVMLDVIKKGYGNKESEFARIPIVITDKSAEWFKEEMIGQLATATAIQTGMLSAQRNIHACSRYVGRMRIDCPYKPLCRYGSQAGLRYVYGDEAKMLNEWPASSGIPPWEI